MTVSRTVLVLAAVLTASIVLAVGIGPTWIAPSTVWHIVIDTVVGNVIPDNLSETRPSFGSCVFRG